MILTLVYDCVGLKDGPLFEAVDIRSNHGLQRLKKLIVALGLIPIKMSPNTIEEISSITISPGEETAFISIDDEEAYQKIKKSNHDTWRIFSGDISATLTGWKNL